MKRSVLMLTILAFGIGTVLGSVTKGPNTAPYGQKLIKKVESCSLLQVPDNHGPSPIIMPSSRDAHFTFIDSSTNGYGMILGVTRPLVVTENDEWFFVFRQWYGEPTPQNNKSGQIGAAYSENGEDWDVYTYLNTGFNWPPSDRQGRYPSALGNEDYPFAFWNEYTSLGSQYGGRPYYTYDEFGWGGGSFADPIEVDPLYDDTKDLWVGSPGYSYDIDNDIHHFNVSYNDWSRNNYYLFHSEVYEDGYIIFGQEILIIDEQNDLVPGTSSGSFNSSTALSMTKDGYGMVGLVGLFAVDQYGNSCDPNNDGDCYHTAIFKLTEDHGATWHGDGGIYYPNYYHIPDNVWDHLLDNACLDQYWDPCLSTYTDLIDLWSWYELDMKVDSEGNPHIVLEVMPCDADGSCYYRNGDGTHIGSGFYHFTIDRDYIDNPGPVNTTTGWNYSFVISGKDTWAFQAPDGDSFIWQTQASIAISGEDDNVVYVVTDMAEPGAVAGYDPQDPYDCEEPYEYYPYWSEDIFVLRSFDAGSTWSDSVNVTNTPDDGEECDPPTMSGWCSPEETFPHAAQWATNDKVYFVYQMPNWYHNTTGDLLALDHVNRLYAGWADPELTQIQQTIQLYTGWNIMSFNNEPDDMDLMVIVQPLIDAGVLIKVQDEAGNAIVELPPPWGWQNGIGDMAVTEGYSIKVNADASLTSIGLPVALPIDILLYAPWNIMGYPLTVSQDGMAVVQPLIDAGVLIKVQDEAGNAIVELPPPWGWQNGIGDFLPGEGYKIKVSSDATLTLNEPSRKVSSLSRVAGTGREREHFTTVWSGNPYAAMNFYVVNYSTINGVDMQPGDEIGIFDGVYCVGACVLTEVIEDTVYLAIVAGEDDPDTPEIDGFTDGNPISYKLWDASAGIEVDSVIAVYTTYPGWVDDGLFESQGQAMISLAGAGVIPDYSVTLTPYNPPIEIPAGGGTFDYNVQLANNTSNTQNFYAVLFAELPNGSQYGPIDPTPYSAHLSPGHTLDVDLTQNVPGNAPTGDYTFYCLVGTNYNNIVDSSGFNFTKLGTAQAAGLDEEWIGYYSAVGVEMRNHDLWTADGIYREDGTLVYGTMGSSDEISLPESFALYQNYPNPFNPTTTITFDIPEASRVTVDIYNLMGQKVRTLSSGELSAGRYKAVWSATNDQGLSVTSGVYFYRITAIDGSTGDVSFTETKKLLLMK